jgi:hypothetical protein
MHTPKEAIVSILATFKKFRQRRRLRRRLQTQLKSTKTEWARVDERINEVRQALYTRPATGDQMVLRLLRADIALREELFARTKSLLRRLSQVTTR